MKKRLMLVYFGFFWIFIADRSGIVDLDNFGLSIEILAVLLVLAVLGVRLRFR